MKSLLILAHGGSWETRYQITSLAATAAATGTRVDLALFFAALDAWVRGGWDRIDPDPPLDPRQIEQLGFPPLSSLLAEPRTAGHLRLYACSGSARFLGLTPEEISPKVDALVGWASFTRMMGEADRVVTF